MRENLETLCGLSFNLTSKKTKASSVLKHTAFQEPQAICLEGNDHNLSELSEMLSISNVHHIKEHNKKQHLKLKNSMIPTMLRKICDISKIKKVLPSELCTTVNMNTRPQRTKDFHSEHPILALTGLSAFHMSGSKSLQSQRSGEVTLRDNHH